MLDPPTPLPLPLVRLPPTSTPLKDPQALIVLQRRAAQQHNIRTRSKFRCATYTAHPVRRYVVIRLALNCATYRCAENACVAVFGGTAQQRITTSIYVLCHKHFNKELKLACTGKEGAPHSLVGDYVDVLKKLDLPVVAKSAVGSIFEDRVEETKSTIVPSVLSPGCHDYSSILKNQDFNIIALMNSATVVGEGQIPAVMVNMTTTSRVGKANSCF